MEIRRRRRKRNVVWFMLGFIVVGAIAFVGIQWVTKTGIFHVPGVVYYDDSLRQDELEKLQAIFTDEVKLDKDVHISAENSQVRPEPTEGEFLYEVLVPVTNFYDTRNDTNEITEGEVEVIPINELDFTKKLLAIDGKYYLDNYSEGAYFRTIKFSSEKYIEEIAPLVEKTFTVQYPDKDTVLTFAQTGVTALARGMNEKLYQVSDAKYFAEKIGEYLAGFDLTHTSNESSFSDSATKSNICSDKRFIDTLKAIGLDIVELTGNHNQDCGNVAARETIDVYNENHISIVGGGKTAKEAAVPLEISKKGTDITMLAYNLSTGGATLDETPGANQYDEENAADEIAAAKERDDFVIVDIQYYECSAYASEYEDPTCDSADSSAGDQIGVFRHLIDLGADVVVGTSAHQPQTYELYGDGVIYYGLGNLFFDQIWWPGTTRSLVLEHYFYDGKLLQTRVVPTVYDENMQTEIMDATTAQWYLKRLIAARPR